MRVCFPGVSHTHHKTTKTPRGVCERCRPLMTTLHVGARPPPCSTLERYASNIANRPFNHGFMPGGPRQEHSSGLRTIQLQSQKLGHGMQCYQKARDMLLAWEMHQGSQSTGIWTDGEAIITWAAMAPGLWVLNPCRTLPTEQVAHRRGQATTVGYATTSGHLLAGYELMTVRYDEADRSVRFEVRSFSRGSGPLGRAIFPLLAPAQLRFFREQVHRMEAHFEGETNRKRERRFAIS